MLSISVLVAISAVLSSAAPTTARAAEFNRAAITAAKLKGVNPLALRDESLSCKDCYSEQYWLLPPLAHHYFPGGVALIQRGSALMGFLEDGGVAEVVELFSTAAENGPGDSPFCCEEEGNYINEGNKDCEEFNACHGGVQNNGYCYSWHNPCRGAESMVALTEALKARSVDALRVVLAANPALLRYIPERGVVQALDCRGALMLQEVAPRFGRQLGAVDPKVGE